MEVVEVKDEAFMIECSRLCGTLLLKAKFKLQFISNFVISDKNSLPSK
jgi:hypothetical protein